MKKLLLLAAMIAICQGGNCYPENWFRCIGGRIVSKLLKAKQERENNSPRKSSTTTTSTTTTTTTTITMTTTSTNTLKPCFPTDPYPSFSSRCIYSNYCIANSQICDGRADCFYGEDERVEGCTPTTFKPCNLETEFKCKSNFGNPNERYNECVPLNQVCNKTFDFLFKHIFLDIKLNIK